MCLAPVDVTVLLAAGALPSAATLLSPTNCSMDTPRSNCHNASSGSTSSTSSNSSSPAQRSTTTNDSTSSSYSHGNPSVEATSSSSSSDRTNNSNICPKLGSEKGRAHLVVNKTSQKEDTGSRHVLMTPAAAAGAAAAAREPQSDCLICFDRFPRSSMVAASLPQQVASSSSSRGTCGHFVCKECMRQYVVGKVQVRGCRVHVRYMPVGPSCRPSLPTLLLFVICQSESTIGPAHK